MAFDINKLLVEIETLLNGSDSVSYDKDDPAIAGIYEELHKARVRFDLSHNNIQVDFPQGGSRTLSIRRIKSGATPAVQPAKTPDQKAKKPTATVSLKRHQHTYVKPAIADDLIAILTDDASHVPWLFGPSQCLAGETQIRINRAKTGASWTIEKLYRAYHGNLPGFNASIPTKVRSFTGKTIRLHDVLDVVYSGRKMVYTLTLADGKSIRLTSDHRVMTRNGFIKAGELRLNDEIMVDNIRTIGSGQGIPSYSKMVSFVPSEETDVYDIKCADPHHNFVANDIVVHNCGKDRLVHFCGRELGREVIMLNCRGDMGSESFFGEKTITIDPITKQQIIAFQPGLCEKAFKTGLDEQGNEVGPPAILCINEAASAPSNVMIGINRMLESDDPRRTMVIDQDGAREIRSHSGLRIIFLSNTVGRGAMGQESMAYTAQLEALDISLGNRIAVFLKMGYDKEVERHILAEKIGDDRVAAMVLKFRDAIRDLIRQNRLTSPFSTGRIVHIADMYRVFGDLGKALYYTTFEFLLPEERAIYNEQAMAILGKDLLKEFTQNNMDYM